MCAQSDPMVIGAMGYLGTVGAEAVDAAALELAGGIGQEVSAEQMMAEAAAVIDKNRERLLTERYRVNGASPGLLAAPYTKLTINPNPTWGRVPCGVSVNAG